MSIGVGNLTRWIVAAPIDEKHGYRFSKIWHYDQPQALALVKRGVEQSLPAYALFVSQKELAEKKARLPELDGYEWVATKISTRDAVILKLCPNNKE